MSQKKDSTQPPTIISTIVVRFETAGTWGQSAIEFVQEIGKRITTVTEETRETMFLFQWLSIACQKENAITFHLITSNTPS